MARAAKWTDEKIRAQRLAQGRLEQRIAVEPGLYLRLRSHDDGSVSKHWEYRAQVGGVRRRLALGSFPAVGLAQARAELRKHEQAHEAAKKGEADHPVIAARFARKAALAQPTVSQLFDEWVSDKRLGSARKGGVPVRARTIAVLTENFDADIKPRIGEAKVPKLTRAALQACIDAPRRRGAPGAAAQVYRTLRGLVNFALARGYIEGADPMRGIENPKPYRPAAVNAANDEELRDLLGAVDASRMSLATKLAIELQLLTGARPSEVRLARWPEINQERATWTIPAERVKSGREFSVHLSAQALAVLERAEAIRSDRSDFVLPGPNGDALEKMAVARALSRLAERRKSEGAKKLRPHDLRRTFRTMLSRLGVPPHVAELCMNHQETETMRRVYDGHDYRSEMIEAWNRIGGRIASLHRDAIGAYRP